MNLLRKMMAALVSRPVSLRDPAHWRNRDDDTGELVTQSSVLGLSAAWACVNLLAGTIGSLPLMVYRTDAAGARSVARDHPLYRLLHDSPNDGQTAVDFWEMQSIGIEMAGSAYAEIDRIGDRIVALTPIRPDIVTVRRREDAGDLEYVWAEAGRQRREPAANVLHIRGFGGSPLGGLSTLTHARKTFGLAGAINQAALKTFVNGLRPSGVLTFAQFLTPEQRKVTEAAILEKFQGAMNAGRPMMLEGGTKWENLTINPEDAQMLQSRAFSIEEICRFFGVPPFMIGHTEKTTSWGTGLEQQVLGFQKFTLRRRLKRIEMALEKQLVTAADRGAGITIEFNLEGLLRGDSASRSAFYAAALMNGWMTINEVRALENRPPLPGGDVLRMQAQNIPITEARGIGDNGGPPLEDTP